MSLYFDVKCDKLPRQKNMNGNTKEVTETQIKEMQNDYEKDVANGLFEISKKGRFTKLVRYLYDPYLQRSFRKCKSLHKTNNAEEISFVPCGSKAIYKIVYIVAYNQKDQYFLYNDVKLLYSCRNQRKMIDWLSANIFK